MLIGGFEKCSLVDYPGKVCCIVYTLGCNFRCKICYNTDILSQEHFNKSGRVLIPEQDVFDYIEKHSNMLDSVSITGGEPTLQSDLSNFCEKIKNLGKLVKIDTNGSNPAALKYLTEWGYVNYIAMDLKGPLELYDKFTGFKNTSPILESIKIINASGVPHEYRLTLLPLLTKENIIETIKLVPGQIIYLQHFESEHAYDSDTKNMLPISRQMVDEIIEETKGVADVRLRGF